jgi:hypothetical protein
MIAKLVALACCVALLGVGGVALAGPPPMQTCYIPIAVGEAHQHYLDLAFPDNGGG